MGERGKEGGRREGGRNGGGRRVVGGREEGMEGKEGGRRLWREEAKTNQTKLKNF